MRTSESGIEFIKQFEYVVLHPYCGSDGIMKIGYKHHWFEGDDEEITQKQADKFLINDLKPFEDLINLHCRVKLNQDQFDALVDYGFSNGFINLADLLGTSRTYEGIHARLGLCDSKDELLRERTLIRRHAEQQLFK